MAELAVVGLGRLGSCLAASLACAGHRVHGVDSDIYAVQAIRENRPTIEPGLNELIDRAGDRLTVSTDLEFSVAATDYTFIVVPTPSTDAGSFDPSAVYEVAHQVKTAAGTDRHTLVVCSTVSPRSMRHLTNLETDTFRTAYCVDEQTEIFTQRGWLRWDQVRVGDETLSIDPGDWRSYWVPIVHLFQDQWFAEMVSMESNGHSSLTTPDHRWLVNCQGKVSWQRSESLRLTDSIPLTADRGDLPSEPKYSDEFVELVGWFWSEGVRNPKGHCNITQSQKVNPQKVERIRRCLTKVFGPSGSMRHRGRWNPTDPTGPHWREGLRLENQVVVFHIGAPGRALLQGVAPWAVPTHEFILSLTRGQLDLLIETALDGDGNRWKGKIVFSQAGPGAADRIAAFEFACAVAGRATNTYRSADDGLHVAVLRRRFTIPRLAAKVARQRFEKGDPTRHGASSADVQVVPYEGMIWCPTVKHGNWLARREGHVYFTGNSPLFIALGQILADMAAPDFRLIGATNPATADLVADILNTLGEAPVAAVGVAEAEVIKLAVNAFLVTKAAFGDAVAQACMSSGVDGRTVLATVGADRRIGGQFLQPGSIPSGPCLPRDSRAMAHWLGRNRIPEGLMHEVNGLRAWQVARVAGLLRPYRTVAVLGVTYKAGTTVCDGSLGSKIADRLERDGIAVICSDPNLPGPSAEEAIADADAVLVATPHPHYAGLDTQGKPTVDMWGCCQPGPNVIVWGAGKQQDWKAR